MKAILEFNLPEDRMDFDCASRAGDLALIVWHIAHSNYGERYIFSEDELIIINRYRNIIIDHMSELGISIDNLTM